MEKGAKIRGMFGQVMEALSGLAPMYRMAVGLIVVLGFVLPAIVIWSSATERYRILLRGVRQKSVMQAITGELEKRGMRYKLQDGGRTLMVPEARHGEALEHIQRESLMPRHHDTELRDLMDKNPSMGLFPEIQKMQRLRMLEMEIAKTIEMYDSVEFARVHITQPREGFFRNESAPVTASVFVDLTPGRHLTADQVATVKSLVSHAVENLSPLNITLCNSAGVDYSRGSTAVASAPVLVSTARDLELARLSETVLEGKVNEHLQRVFGADSYTVSVTVEMTSTQKTADLPSGMSLAGGANGHGPSRAAHPAQVHLARSRMQESCGQVKRLSVSVLLDSHALLGHKLEASLRDAVESDLKAAVGFSASRGDTLSVVAAPYHRPRPAEEQVARAGRPRGPGLASATGALSVVASNFHAFWVGQVVVLLFMLGFLVRHVGAPLRTASLAEPERMYPVRLDQVLAPRPVRIPATTNLESYLGRGDLDLSNAFARADEKTLVLVLRTAAGPVRELVLSNLTPDRARELLARLDHEGPVPLSQAEEARRSLAELLAAAQKRGGRA